MVAQVVIATMAAAAMAQTADGSKDTADARVILVMTDGLRWQEVFRGADKSLLVAARYYAGRNVDALKERYLAGTPEERRKRLMPFLWETFIPNGQIYGDRDAGSDASVTNGFNFSYPGYSETLTGHGDPRIDSNDNKPNPNMTVLEWLNKQPGLEGKVAAFGAWNTISGITNPGRSGLTVNAGFEPLQMSPMTPELELLNKLKLESPRVWEDEPFDDLTFNTAMEYLRTKQPRVMFLSLGETDEWAHAGNYGEYLDAAHRVDGYLKQLWDELQSMDGYRGNTTVIFLVDHGRGDAPEEWKSHGQKIAASKYIFMGFMGRGVPATGLRTNVQPVTQSQVAATLAGYLGLDWDAAEKQAGKPVAGAMQ
jgi:Type I phosphodiesterase / nucleotide pyrophosphatase